MNIANHRGRVVPVAIALLLAAAPAAGRQTAADRTGRQEARRAQRVEQREARHEAALARFGERLDLSDTQMAAVRGVMQVDEETGQRGDGWMLAAVLDRSLSDEQLDKLFETSRGAAIFRRGMAEGFRRAGARQVRSDAVPAAATGAMANQRRFRLESMKKALQLTDEQVRILRIHEALSGIMSARTSARSMRRQDARPSGAGVRFRGARGTRSGLRFGR